MKILFLKITIFFLIFYIPAETKSQNFKGKATDIFK